MKSIFILIALCFISTAKAQVNKALPTKQQWETYFFEKKAAIQTKLYNLALQGKLKGYYNDSLASYFSIEDLKKRGGKENIVNIADRTYPGEYIDSVVFEPLNPKDISSFWFEKTIDYDQNLQKETNELKAITLNFSPTIMGMQLKEMPLFFLSISDLKIHLSKDEYDWLMLVYFYIKRDNTIRFIENNDDTTYDRFWNIKLFPNITHTTDSLFFKKLSTSLFLSHFYINNFFYYDIPNYTRKPFIYDNQLKKLIDLNQFDEKYYNLISVPILDNNGDYFKDTLIRERYNNEKINSVEWNLKSQKIENIIFFITNGIEKSSLKFSIPITVLKNENMLPKNFWFFEDYYRSYP